MNLLNLLDEDYNKDKKYISIINKITNDNNYEKYKIIDKNSNFKWSVDNQFVEILIKDCNIEDYQYYTFDLKGAIEGVKKNRNCIYFINCNNGLYRWVFNDKEIMINYDFNNDNNNISNRFSVLNSKFQLYN